MERERMTELLFRAADGELDDDLAAEVRGRIETCQDCAREAVYVRRFLEVVRERCGRVDAPSRLRLRILTGFEHRNSQPQ